MVLTKVERLEFACMEWSSEVTGKGGGAGGRLDCVIAGRGIAAMDTAHALSFSCPCALPVLRPCNEYLLQALRTHTCETRPRLQVFMRGMKGGCRCMHAWIVAVRGGLGGCRCMHAWIVADWQCVEGSCCCMVHAWIVAVHGGRAGRLPAAA